MSFNYYVLTSSYSIIKLCTFMEEFPQKKDCSFIYALCHIKFSNTLDGKMTFSRLFNWIITFPYILIVFCRQQNMLYSNVLMRKIIRMVGMLLNLLKVKFSLRTQAIINLIFETYCGVRVDHHVSFL